MTNSQGLTITSRGRYAVMALIAIGGASRQSPVPLVDIAKNAQISLSYLEQLIAGLRRNGIVKSFRGPGGGYVLNRNPDDILISEVIQAAEDSTPAKRSKKTEMTSHCKEAEYLWNYIGAVLKSKLSTISLADVLNHNIA